MSLPLLVQLATGNQQGRSQPDKGCANDPSNGAHPSRVAPAFGRQPRGAPDHRMSARHRIRASGTGEHLVPAARSWHEVTSTPRSADSRGGTCFRGLIPFYALTITAGSTVCEPSVNRGVPHRRHCGPYPECRPTQSRVRTVADTNRSESGDQSSPYLDRRATATVTARPIPKSIQ